MFFQNTLRRTYEDAFRDNDNDDEWVFDPALDRVMVGGGVAANPLLEFELQPVGVRRNWKNVLNRQRFEATLRQRRDIAPTDNLGQELTRALERSIEQQIAADNTLTPHSTVHFNMQSSAFTHAFQSTAFTVREFEEGSGRLETSLWTPPPRGQTQLQRRICPRRYLYHGDTWTWQWTQQTLQTELCRRSRHREKVPRHYQEQGQPVLCTCHRHDEVFGGR